MVIIQLQFSLINLVYSQLVTGLALVVTAFLYRLSQVTLMECYFLR